MTLEDLDTVLASGTGSRHQFTRYFTNAYSLALGGDGGRDQGAGGGHGAAAVQCDGMNSGTCGTGGAGMSAEPSAWSPAGFGRILASKKTRQGYARKRILKPAGYFFVRRVSSARDRAGSMSWQR